jgi:N utilization substance protein B
MTLSRRKSRVLVVQALYSQEFNRQDMGNLMEFPWYEYDGDDRDDRLVFSRLLLHGIVEHLEEVDAEIKSHLEHWEFERLGKVDLAIMRLGSYELMFSPDTPRQIVINEAVEIAKEFGAQQSFRIINGVLDAIHPLN